MKAACKIVLKIMIAEGFILSLILWLSLPTRVDDVKNPWEPWKNIEYLCSVYSHYLESQDYYASLEKDTSLYKSVLNQLEGEERVYFLQMRPFLSEIAKASQKTGITVSSLASHIKRESQFDPWAVSNKEAYGLMGITIKAYQDVVRLRPQKKWIAEVLDEYGDLSWERVKTNLELNIVVGTIYYKFLLDEFEDTTLASLAYNWGMGNVYLMQERYGGKESILTRLEQLASFHPAWVEPAQYPGYISDFQAVFQRVEEKIELACAYQEAARDNFALLRPPQKSPSS